jgi:hypothetical protein
MAKIKISKHIRVSSAAFKKIKAFFDSMTLDMETDQYTLYDVSSKYLEDTNDLVELWLNGNMDITQLGHIHFEYKTLKIEGKGRFTFFCSGCNHYHTYFTKEAGLPNKATWQFDNNIERPTFTPSLLNTTEFNDKKTAKKICHLFVTDGMVQYLNDCTHKFAGQTIELPIHRFIKNN